MRKLHGALRLRADGSQRDLEAPAEGAGDRARRRADRSVFLDFLAGNQEFHCTTRGMPTRNSVRQPEALHLPEMGEIRTSSPCRGDDLGTAPRCCVRLSFRGGPNGPNPKSIITMQRFEVGRRKTLSAVALDSEPTWYAMHAA